MADLNLQTVTLALAPAFAVGVGIQHLNELLDVVFSAIARNNINLKKLFMGLSSFCFGCLAARTFDLNIVGAVGGHLTGTKWTYGLNIFITALIISTGTEGINSIVKFLGYSKDQKKATAAESEKETGPDAMKLVNREP